MFRIKGPNFRFAGVTVEHARQIVEWFNKNPDKNECKTGANGDIWAVVPRSDVPRLEAFIASQDGKAAAQKN